MDFLDREQREAVFCEVRYILVAAPPGSGKTRVLASRFARLLNEGVDLSAIAALTFTEKAAMEMSVRVGLATGLDMKAASIGTFHALCLGILKKTNPELRVYGRLEQLEALGALGLKHRKAEKAAARISYIKNCGGFGAAPDDDFLEIYDGYERYLREKCALDLDDLIIEGARVLEDKEFRGARFTHVMVDEYQDINAPQARLLRALVRGHGHVFAIGDPDQAIYSFRGASLGFFLRFKDEWDGAVVKNLGTNYRSASKIVYASQALIRHNKERFDLFPAPARSGGRVSYIECADEASINSCIIKEIESRMGGLTSLTVGEEDGGARFSDFAVLYRTRSSARSLVEAFRTSSLPYHLVSPAGSEFREFLERLQAQGGGTGLTIAALIEKEAAAAALGEGMRELLLWLAVKYGDEEAPLCLEAFIEEARALGDTEVPEIKADKVNLMTLHGAKGLEFKTVFIAGVEEGLIPLRRKDSSLEEERRLFYVGLTRASEEVVLLSAKKRRSYAVVEETKPSPFIKELGEFVVKTRGPAPKKYIRRAVQKGLFE